MPESRSDAHHGAEWTLCEDFFIAEDGQGEDRLIMFAMSSLTLLIVCFIVHLYSKQYKELLERSFFRSG